MKNFFINKEYKIKKQLEDIIETKEFKKKDNGNGAKDLKMLTDGVLTFYAEMFFDGNKEIARNTLDAQNNKIRTNDAVLISLFAGATII